MKLTKLPLVVGAALVLTVGTAAAAYALVADATGNPTDSGNSLPIDDNHATTSPSPAAVKTAVPHDDRSTTAPRVRATARPAEHATPEAEHATPEPGDDNGVHATPEAEHATPEPGDDNGVHATPEAEHATPEPGDDNGGSGKGKGGGSGTGSGKGSDDGGGHS